MAGIVILQGPPPPASPMGFCAVCAGIGKHVALAPLRGEVNAHEARGEGVKRWPLKVPGEYLSAAVAWGSVPQLGMAAPLCWSHLPAIDARGSGIIPAAPGLPDGIPLLGQG